MSDGQVSRWKDKIAAVIEDWGDLAVEDIGADGPLRSVSFSLDCPGDGNATEVLATYREVYARSANRWDLIKYTYEYHDLVHKNRLAYHWHDIGKPPPVYHAHCHEFDPAVESPEVDHLRATPVALLEAHDDFMEYYAGGVFPDCADFRPLALRR